MITATATARTALVKYGNASSAVQQNATKTACVDAATMPAGNAAIESVNVANQRRLQK